MRRVSVAKLESFLGVFCFFVTFFLIGVWHGRTSEFVFFGVLCGLGVSINKLWQLWLTHMLGRKAYNKLARSPVYEAAGRGLNFVWFSFTLFWFWADWKQIDLVFTALSPAKWLGVWLAAWLFASVILVLWEWLHGYLLSRKTANGPIFTSRYARVIYASTLGLIAFVMTFLLNQPAPDIVYKAF
jgi:D-alanyl-lipoteichoic acid acyltransferase DltB (MBOAT superfamily)